MRPEIELAGQKAIKARTFIDEARRSQIIKSTIEVLADVGFGRTTLAEIARRAGTSKGVISYHFAGKQDLIEQVVAHAFKEGGDWMQSLLEQEIPASEKLRAYFDGNMAFMKTQPRYLKALMEIFLNYRREDGSPFYDGTEDEASLVFIEAVLRQGQETGEFRRFSTRVMGLTIRGSVDLVPMRVAVESELDLDAYSVELFELFWRAIRAEEVAKAPPERPQEEEEE